MMGDGVIDIPAIRALVEAAGYGGMIEVEILSQAWWQGDADLVMATVRERFAEAV
jgi:sugar phosphate isomerase/epimerase